jgi:hypothetical protein
MKKTARYLLVLLALSGVATAFAEVGGHTKPTGGLYAPTTQSAK